MERIEDRLPAQLVHPMATHLFKSREDEFRILDQWSTLVDDLLDDTSGTATSSDAHATFLEEHLALIGGLEPRDVDLLIQIKILIGEWELLLMDQEKLLGHLFLVHGVPVDSKVADLNHESLINRHEHLHAHGEVLDS